jgi:L-tartrate/succinate antiporter
VSGSQGAPMARGPAGTPPGPTTSPPGRAGTPVLLKAVVPLTIGVVLAVLPTPAGLTPGAWHYFALFATVLVALMLEPIPASAVGFIGMTAAAASRLVVHAPDESLKWALSGFANGTVWLIFAAFMFALGYEKSGLGRRIALALVRRLGGSTLGVGYAIVLADVALAPFTPSNTARSAGTIFPIVQNIPPLYDSHPGPTARRIGAYLIYVAFAATTVTSSMFATALAPNLLALGMVEKTVGYRISMGGWVLGFLPIGVLLVAVLPWLIYRLYPPEIAGGQEVPRWARSELRAMGPLSRREWIMAGLALTAITLWIFAGDLVEPATAALIVVALMVTTGVVSWSEIVANKAAWNVLILLATLVALADGLSRVGFIAWFARGSAAALTGLPPVAVMAGLVAAFFLIHYMFASITAQTTAVLPVVLAAGAAVPGLPVRTFALLLCYSQGLMGILTPYATGPAPVFFGSGYIARGTFWALGFVLGVIFLATLLGVGIPYLGVVQP